MENRTENKITIGIVSTVLGLVITIVGFGIKIGEHSTRLSTVEKQTEENRVGLKATDANYAQILSGLKVVETKLDNLKEQMEKTNGK